MSQNNNSIGLNELVDYQSKTYDDAPTMKKIMEFLWKCGGADKQILKYAPYSDHIKNAGIGGVVLATTVMAGLAMGFAMHTIFAEPTGEINPITKEAVVRGNWFITIPISIIWALIIFNLDRFIVSTVKGDGTEKITGGELFSMAPRLIMAIIIGLTISAPLETYIFSKEITRELNQSRALTIQMKQNQIETRYANDLARILKIKEEKKAKLESLEPERLKLDKEVMDETNRVECGPRCQAKKEERLKWEANVYKPALDEFNKVEAEYKDVVKKKDKEIAEKEKETEKEAFGFLDQILALEKLAEPKYVTTKDQISGKMVEEQIRGSGAAAIWLVRLLFMIVEIAPVIFKFMIWKSSYDYMQDNVAQVLEAKQGISLENIVDEKNNSHNIRENYNARRIVEVSKRQNDLEKENAIHAITLFAEKQREEIEKNPEAFINNTQDEAQNPDAPDNSNTNNPNPPAATVE
jgi:uncharacterized membrane protein